MTRYVEPGASWRPFWLTAAATGGLTVAVLLLGRGGFAATLAAALLGGVCGRTIMARRAWTVRVDGEGREAALTVGRERVRLAHVDTAHLRAVRAGRAGVDAGAPLLGGTWSLPRGRTGLPLRLTDGHTVLVPTRDPAALTSALLAGRADAADGGPGPRGTLGP